MNGPFRIVSLCSGIGGLELGLERAGLGQVVVQVEIDAACRRVLARHWPEAVRHDDLRTWEGKVPGAGPILLCAGFPCQPYSKAGRGLAEEDPRDLWPAVARAIRLVGPQVVVLENVERLLQLGMGRVLGDLAALGFDAEWDCIPAASVGAPHLRDRVFLVAYAHGSGRLHRQDGIDAAERRQPALSLSLIGGEAMADTDPTGCDRTALRQRWVAPSAWRGGWPAEPGVPRVVDGVPSVLDEIRQYGNAVCPPAAEHVGRIVLARLGGGRP